MLYSTAGELILASLTAVLQHNTSLPIALSTAVPAEITWKMPGVERGNFYLNDIFSMCFKDSTFTRFERVLYDKKWSYHTLLYRMIWVVFCPSFDFIPVVRLLYYTSSWWLDPMSTHPGHVKVIIYGDDITYCCPRYLFFYGPSYWIYRYMHIGWSNCLHLLW